MPKKGYDSVTLPDRVIEVIIKYIEANRAELEFRYGKRGLKSAVVREAIYFWAKQKGLLLEQNQE